MLKMARCQNSKIGNIHLKDGFFAPRIRINHTETIPANIRKCHETKRIEAFKLDWKPGMPDEPHVYWDSDVAKVLEGIAYDLILNPDPEREKELDRYVDLICSAQQPDGYLNVYFTVVEPEKRWTNIAGNHELYCAGHLMEAAVAYYQATGKRKFLDCMCRYADYICKVFGREPGQKRAYPGHQEIELALCKLADATGNQAYLKLAKYFVDERGTSPNYFVEKEGYPEKRLTDLQAHKPVREQTEAVGHAVRALYLYSGMADVAERSGDRELLEVCEKLWDDLTLRKMYITGGVGSNPDGEKFEDAYELPNRTAYSESCASMALVFFANRMLKISGDSKYADIMERALYNGAISGISLNGVEFFYANPQLVTGISIKHQYASFPQYRQPWFGCSCCPTNFCRFIPQIASFAFSVAENELRVNIPAAAQGSVRFANGAFSFEIEGNYPADGHIVFRVLDAPASECTVSFRIPGWCRNYKTSMNGSMEKGYLAIRKQWKKGDEFIMDLDMPIEMMFAHPLIAENAGRSVLRRGPLLYCLEEKDNGSSLSSLIIPADQKFRLEKTEGLLDLPGITGKAYRENTPDMDSLYSTARPVRTECGFHAVPYALWQNRGVGEMVLWIRTE